MTLTVLSRSQSIVSFFILHTRKKIPRGETKCGPQQNTLQIKLHENICNFINTYLHTQTCTMRLYRVSEVHNETVKSVRNAQRGRRKRESVGDLNEDDLCSILSITINSFRVMFSSTQVAYKLLLK